MRCLHIQQRSAGPDDIIATGDSIEDAERDPWTNIPDLHTTSCCSLWSEERLCWWLVIPSFLLNLTIQTSKPWCVWFALEPVQGWLNTWQFILGHRTNIDSMGCSVCCWIKDLRTKTSIFSSGEKKDLLWRQRDDWSPYSEMRNSLRVFTPAQRLRQILKISNAIGFSPITETFFFRLLIIMDLRELWLDKMCVYC